MHSKLLLAGACILGATQARVVRPRASQVLSEPPTVTWKPTYADRCPCDPIDDEEEEYTRPPGGKSGRRAAAPEAVPTIIARGEQPQSSVGPPLGIHYPPPPASSYRPYGSPHRPAASPYIGHTPVGWGTVQGQSSKGRPRVHGVPNSEEHPEEETPQSDSDAEPSQSDEEEQQTHGRCKPMPVGSGPTPSHDTAKAFLEYQVFADLANDAATPDGYSLVDDGMNLHAAVTGDNFIAAVPMKNYDTEECADQCNQHDDCAAFNTYFERSPRYAPNPVFSACQNPRSSTNIVCTLWGDQLDKDHATNEGGMRSSFAVVVAGSNLYNRNDVPERKHYESDPSGPHESNESTETSPEDDTPAPPEQASEDSHHEVASPEDYPEPTASSNSKHSVSRR